MESKEMTKESKASTHFYSDSGSSDTQEKAAQERLSIVNKYEKGPTAEDEFEDENTYKEADQFGFLHKTALPEIPKYEEDQRRSMEVKRRNKWLKMLRNWIKYVGTDKLAKRTYKGIPHGMRGDVWRLLLGVEQYLENMPNVYQEMKIRAHGYSPDIRQIDVDVNRTYRDHIMFKTRYSIKQQQLFHVLAAYSMYNTEVGYCQGMSQIAALLLMYMDEEEAFWALHSLLYGERHRMHGFFIPGFPKLLRFQAHHDNIIKKFMPKLKKHLDENEVYASLYTMKWFFQCFLDRSPFSLTLRLWDIYIYEGEKLLTAMSFTILKLHKAYLKTQDMDGIVNFLQEQLVKDFGTTDDSVIDYLKGCMIELRRANVDRPPAATDAESPKLPFGSSFAPNFDKSALAKIIPKSAMHTAEITTLPSPARKDSTKKKREKVKRGKSILTPKTRLESTDQNSDGNIKGSKSFKEPEPIRRSPILRRSLKKKNDKKSKDTKKVESKKKSTEPDNQKSKRTAIMPKSENRKPDALRNKSPSKNRVLASQREDNSSQASPGNNSKSSQSLQSNERLNGKTKNAEGEQIHFDSGSNKKPDRIHRELSSVLEKRSLNNSSNTVAHSSSNIQQKPVNDHSNSQSHNRAIKTFVPPLLSHGKQSHVPVMSDNTAQNQKLLSTTNLVWKTPSHESKSAYAYKESSRFHFHGNARSVSSHHIGDSVSNGMRKSESADIRTTSPARHSNKSGAMKYSAEVAAGSKTLSFSQLSSQLDSLENFSLSETGSPGRNSDGRSPQHSSFGKRPPSLYDNVMYEENDLMADPATPGLSGVDRGFSHAYGLEETEERYRGSTNIGGKSIKTRKSKSSYAEDKTEFDSKTRRPKSMGVIEDRGENDDYSWTSTKKGRRRSSLLAGRESSGRSRGKNIPVSYSLGTIDPSRNEIKESSRNVDRISSDLLRKNVSSSRREVTSPFQKAVEDCGILQNQDRPRMNRRQSREEIVKEAVLSQMKRKKSRNKKKNEREIVSKPQTKTPRARKYRSKSSEWELDSGRMLVSSQQQGKIPTRNRIENDTKQNYADRRSLANDYRDLPVQSDHSKGNLVHGTTNTVKNVVMTGENVLHQSVVHSASSTNGWNCVEMDRLPVQSASAEFSHRRGRAQQRPMINLDLDSNCDIDTRNQTDTTKGVSYYSRHQLTEPTSSVDAIKSDSIAVPRYPLVTENLIDITRYSPKHSPIPAKTSVPRRSPAISENSRSDINDLLSAGINANPELIHKYENSIPNTAVNNRFLFVWPDDASLRNGDHNTVINRQAAYRVEEDHLHWKPRVNISVQTED